MAILTIEQRIEQLEKLTRIQKEINDKQEHEIAKITAAQDVENLINNYEYYSEAGRWEDVTALFAMNTHDVRSEILNWGVFEGPKGIMSLYLGICKTDSKTADGSGMKPGYMIVNSHTTPVIEVAQDGQTAKGLWIVFGVAATPPACEARWHWLKLAADFIKEKSGWRIWHFHLYGIFETTYDKSWDKPGKHYLSDIAPANRKPPVTREWMPQRPTTHPLWWYSPQAVNDPVPAPPASYKTFNEKEAY
jgi:hypothetical protein